MVAQRYRLYDLAAALAGAALTTAALVSGYWWVSSTEAERYAALPAEVNLALTNRDAAKWMDLIRRNQLPGALAHRTPATTTNGGKACSFV
jgi:hypothetical protein